MDSPELPECPVCLQPFDGDSTIPRVLACGHSACESCLVDLPKAFPRTLRCPACTQLVPYPHPQGPSALPKNIDLLRLSSLLSNPDHRNSPKPTEPQVQTFQDFVPNLGSPEFYSNWKHWVVPEGAVVFDSRDGVCFYGRIGGDVDLFGSPTSCLLKKNQKVSLLRVGSFSGENDASFFKYSYTAKIMRALFEMGDAERTELGFILRASLRGQRIHNIYGLCYNEDDNSVYVVSERYNSSFFDFLKNGMVCTGVESANSTLDKEFSGVAMTGMGICEAVSGLHKDALVAGCLSLSCLDVDDFGHVLIDLNEVMETGERFLCVLEELIDLAPKLDREDFGTRLRDEISKMSPFVSPELLLHLLNKQGLGVVGYHSDAWALACILIFFLIGKPFAEEMHDYLHSFVFSATYESDSDFEGIYLSWLDKVSTLLDPTMGLEFVLLKEMLYQCLDFNSGNRPLVKNIWKCIRDLIVKPEFDFMGFSEQVDTDEDTVRCLVLGDLCQLLKKNRKTTNALVRDELQTGYEKSRADIQNGNGLSVDKDIVGGFSRMHLKGMELKGHHDCITGLAIGGGFLFSSSFDKTVRVWSLQELMPLHTFGGHEHRVMAVVYVEQEQPLCISGDSGGGICIWGIKFPFEEEPIKKLYEQKDWRYSGIHALAVSGTGYFYSGSGDKLIKAWSIQDFTLSCTMTGHRAAVSTLAVCNGTLFSGSWDGTIRLWCLSDHSPLAELGDDTPGNVICVPRAALLSQLMRAGALRFGTMTCF